jgi:hypothetical protein
MDLLNMLTKSSDVINGIPQEEIIQQKLLQQAIDLVVQGVAYWVTEPERIVLMVQTVPPH